MAKLKDIWLVLKGELNSDMVKLAIAEAKEQQLQANAMAKSLREADHVFYQIQSSGPNAWPAILRPACEAAMLRKNVESKRITNILVPEIERTYGR